MIDKLENLILFPMLSEVKINQTKKTKTKGVRGTFNGSLNQK